MDRLAALPSLFDNYEDDPAPPPSDAPGERSTAPLVRKMIGDVILLRRDLAPELEEYRPLFNTFIEDLRALSRLSGSQLEEQILYSIEKQGATTVTEISEDLRMAPEKIKAKVEEMMDRGDLYKVKKYIPGSDRAWYMIKSRRQNIPEADEVFNRTPTATQMIDRLTYESDLNCEDTEEPPAAAADTQDQIPKAPKRSHWHDFQFSKRARRRARHAIA